jgi:hypothetical protein
VAGETYDLVVVWCEGLEVVAVEGGLQGLKDEQFLWVGHHHHHCVVHPLLPSYNIS